VIFSHYFQLQLAQPTWLRCRAQVDEPKPRPSVPGPDQLKLDKAGTTSLRKGHPTITQQCFFFNTHHKPRRSASKSVCRRNRLRKARATGSPALPASNPPVGPGGPQNYKASRASNEMSANAESLDSSTCPANNGFYIEQAPWQRKDWEVSVCPAGAYLTMTHTSPIKTASAYDMILSKSSKPLWS